MHKPSLSGREIEMTNELLWKSGSDGAYVYDKPLKILLIAGPGMAQ